MAEKHVETVERCVGWSWECGGRRGKLYWPDFRRQRERGPAHIEQNKFHSDLRASSFEAHFHVFFAHKFEVKYLLPITANRMHYQWSHCHVNFVFEIIKRRLSRLAADFVLVSTVFWLHLIRLFSISSKIQWPSIFGFRLAWFKISCIRISSYLHTVSFNWASSMTFFIWL